MKQYFLTLLVAAGFCGAAMAQKGKTVSADTAVIETILEDQDQLARVTSAHTKQIKDLEERIAALQRQLQQVSSETEEAKKLREELAALKARLEETGGPEQEGGVRLVAGPNVGGQLSVQPIFQLRIRPEYQDNKTDFSSARADDDVFYLQRLRFGAALKAGPYVRGVVVAQDSRSWGEEASTISDEKNLDLHEGYVEVRDFLVKGLGIQAGRMELKYGAERQVGALDWGNVGRAFDGVRLFYEKPKLIKADIFATIVKDEGRAGRDNTDFIGLYVTSNYLTPLDIEFYNFFLYNDTPGYVEKIGTTGIRLVARPASGLVLEAEAAVQYGKSHQPEQTRPETNKHIATAYFAQALYTAPVYGKPTFGAFFYSASGDADPTDDRNVAYRVLFPTTHPMLGYMDLFQWTGNWDIGPTLRFEPVKDVSLRLDYHLFFLSSNGGVLANSMGGTLVVPAHQGRFLGHELDFVARWQALAYLAVEAGYSFFKPGKASQRAWVVRDGQTLRLGKDLSHWFYFQGTVGF